MSDNGSEKYDGYALDQNNGNDLAARVNVLADVRQEMQKRREESINELQERFREHERLMEKKEQERL